MTTHSDDHRAELFERAYRRGTEWRVRRRSHDRQRPRVGRSVVVFHDDEIDQPDHAASIAVVPSAEVPPDVAAWAHGLRVVGGGALWAARPLIDIPPDHQGDVWRLKFSWFTRPLGLPTISGRRLDGPGGRLPRRRQRRHRRSRHLGRLLVGILRPGCCEITGRYRNSTIRFRVHIPADTSGTATSALRK